MTLKEYISLIESADPENYEDFYKILNLGIEVLKLSDTECARMFDVSRSSIVSWKKEKTKPHTIIRKLVFRELLAEAEDIEWLNAPLTEEEKELFKNAKHEDGVPWE